MGTACDLERSIVVINIVQMDPQGDHPGKHVERRCHMLQPVLDRPWTETRRVAPFRNAYRPVLMPAKRPVPCSSLIEQNRANWPAMRAQCPRSDGTDRPGRRKNSLQPVKPLQPDPGLVRRQICEGAHDPVDAIIRSTNMMLCTMLGPLQGLRRQSH